MTGKLQRQWRALRRSPPGRRFQDRYRAVRGRGGERRAGGRVVRIGLATVALAVGVVFVVTPGPAIVFFLVAGALLASEWLALARALDWTEVKMRHQWRGLKQWWGALSRTGKVGTLLALAVLGGNVAVLCFWVLFR